MSGGYNLEIMNCQWIRFYIFFIENVNSDKNM